MKKYSFLLLVVICLMMTACAAGDAGVNGSWKLISYGSSNSLVPAVPNVDAVFSFDDGVLSGNSGCNSFRGDYKVNGDQITFGSVAFTEMGCPSPQMEQESVVQQVLTGAGSFKIEVNTLTITNQNMLLVFESVEE